MVSNLEISLVAIMFGLLVGILWSLRILYGMDYRIARIEKHLFNIVKRLEKEEEKIEKEEDAIEKAVER